MNDGIRVFLPEELERKIKREADAEHLSLADYISMVMGEAMSGKPDVGINDEEESINQEKSRKQDRSNEVRIHLYGDDAIQLKQKAAEIGLNATAYIRRIIYTKEFVNIPVYTDDLEDFMKTFDDLERGVLTTISFINRNSKEVFVQDVETIKLYLERIADLVGKQVKMSYASRLKVERAMTKSIKEQINSLKG